MTVEETKRGYASHGWDVVEELGQSTLILTKSPASKDNQVAPELDAAEASGPAATVRHPREKFRFSRSQHKSRV